jgi:hypothetical protein
MLNTIKIPPMNPIIAKVTVYSLLVWYRFRLSIYVFRSHHNYRMVFPNFDGIQQIYSILA